MGAAVTWADSHLWLSSEAVSDLLFIGFKEFSRGDGVLRIRSMADELGTTLFSVVGICDLKLRCIEVLE